MKKKVKLLLMIAVILYLFKRITGTSPVAYEDEEVQQRIKAVKEEERDVSLDLDFERYEENL